MRISFGVCVRKTYNMQAFKSGGSFFGVLCIFCCCFIIFLKTIWGGGGRGWRDFFFFFFFLHGCFLSLHDGSAMFIKQSTIDT